MSVRRRIGEVAKDVLLAAGCNSVIYGDLDLLHAISKAAGHKQAGVHPITKLKRVLDSLARDSARPGAAMAMYWGRWGMRGQLCRGFWIKGTEPAGWVKE